MKKTIREIHISGMPGVCDLCGASSEKCHVYNKEVLICDGCKKRNFRHVLRSLPRLLKQKLDSRR